MWPIAFVMSRESPVARALFRYLAIALGLSQCFAVKARSLGVSRLPLIVSLAASFPIFPSFSVIVEQPQAEGKRDFPQAGNGLLTQIKEPKSAASTERSPQFGARRSLGFVGPFVH